MRQYGCPREAKYQLGKAPETERRFYQRLRDTPKIKDYESSKGRGFKGIRLKNPDEKPQGQKQTQLTHTPRHLNYHR